MSARFERHHVASIAFGAVLIAAGILLPRSWYDALPTNPDVPALPIRGVTLLQFVLAIEGLVLLAAGLLRMRYVRIEPGNRVDVARPAEPAMTLSRRAALVMLLVITGLALVLRCIELGSDLWIDELRAVLDAREMSTLAVVASYVRSNVHMLVTLLMKLSFAVFGEAEWSARLPIALFGTATVPVLYWLARFVASREVSLGAALVLAVSYHHIFFSQNARGYVPYLFFSLVSSGLLLQAMRDDRLGTWTLYVLAMVLNFATLLLSGFVFAAHILVGVAAVVRVRARGGSVMPLARRLAAVFGITGLLGFQLYSVQLPQVFAYIGTTYASLAAGYWLFSIEFVREMSRGLLAGFGPGLLLGAVPFLVLAGIGFVAFVRRQWILASALVLPVVLTAVLLFVRNLTVSPRFFLLGLPVAALTGVIMIDLCADFLARKLGWSAERRRAAFAVVVSLLAIASLASLGRYYRTPKQPYRAALAFAAEQRRPGQVIVAIHTAQRGCAYYAAESGLTVGRDLFLADDLAGLDSVLARRAPAGAVLITSMPRALHLVHPKMERRIDDGWQVARTLPATIGDGQISVWTGRQR